MGQCCGKCKESQELDVEAVTSDEFVTALVPAEETPDRQDVTVTPQQEEEEEERGDESESPSLPTESPSAVSLPSPPEYPFLDFPFLQDVKTIEYVMKCKVMVILKGLPGSGKSFLSSQLTRMYKDATVCSADFFFMKDGEYEFSIDKLKSAHEFCQQNARKAAVRGTHMIIIDNTNLQAWNYKYYLKLSKDYNYTPLVVEPQTSWAKNTKQLAKKNIHGIGKEALDQKLKKYEPVLPLYYWWFLNEEDSACILNMAQDWLRKSLQVHEFFEDFREFSKLTSVGAMLKYYRKNEGPRNYKVLHTTTCVTSKGKAKNAMEYMKKKAVRESLGKNFTLYIIGFVMTPRTFGVRLRLEEEALEVWGMDEDETELEEKTATNRNPIKMDDCVSLSDTSLRMDSSQKSTIKIGKSQLHETRYYPTSGRGRRAHITLGCAPQIPAKTTGFDLMKVISCEQRMRNGNLREIESFSIPEGELRTYGDSLWVIYPEKEINVSSMFSAFF